jgi:hypothetical protein
VETWRKRSEFIEVGVGTEGFSSEGSLVGVIYGK